MIVRPICVAILLLALAGCAAPRGQMPEEAGLPPAAAPAPMAAREIDEVLGYTLPRPVGSCMTRETW